MILRFCPVNESLTWYLTTKIYVFVWAKIILAKTFLSVSLLLKKSYYTFQQFHDLLLQNSPLNFFISMPQGKSTWLMPGLCLLGVRRLQFQRPGKEFAGHLSHPAACGDKCTTSAFGDESTVLQQDLKTVAWPSSQLELHVSLGKGKKHLSLCI